MHSQVTSELLMVRPANFSSNIETLKSNNFQEGLQKTDSKNNIQSLALIEFEKMLRILRDHKITVIDIDDIKELNNTDAIFPNNWVTFHQNNTVVLYPMMAHSRRSERRYDILQYLEEYQSYNINRIIDLSYLEEDNYFLEGTGSMIFDRVNRTVFASKSSRTSIEALEVFCEELKYKPIIFEAFNNNYPIYHTNVMMSLGKKTAFICSDSIKNEKETFLIKDYLKDSGREIIEITIQQMNQFAGNVIEVQNEKGISHLILSQAAYQALEEKQIDLINNVSKIVSIPLETIEKYGGGSARCMIAEIFLQKN
tara:strand:+ start:255 stop:1187 length:933 start_codon:yes stop_codon:yes gene_type:complete